ncbi:hypothetical protein [Desulfonatronum thioautotrophicum]|uniref:hypothetical protein n=1 Tax=Desulfonatronum thioautotrophicum TaxID=617001 RepID=UPI0005EB9852|nr:hypothetical protein [Desulfonatronum thioautotrophicum]
MDEQTRIWQEMGLRFVLRSPHLVSAPDGKIPGEVAHAQPQPSTLENSVPGLTYPEPLMFYRRRLHPPIVAIITYASLDHDFRGRPNQERVHLIHAIIDKAMPWSLDDVAFWPPAVYSEVSTPVEAMVAPFFRIVAELSPKYILDFGGCTTDSFAPCIQLSQHDSFDSPLTRHVVLPSLDDMLPDNKPVKKAAWDIIRSLTP